MTEKTYSGFVAVVGRPNVGKSTLINYALGQKLSITSRKAQTTRHNILGVKTEGNYQIIFVDTPGVNLVNKTALHRHLNKSAGEVIQEVQLILFVVEAGKWTEEDAHVLSFFKESDLPVFLVVNKIDKLKDKEQLVHYIQAVSSHFNFSEVIPTSAKSGKKIEILLSQVCEKLPENPFMFDASEVTTRPLAFRLAEIIREKVIRQLGDELPYSTAVDIETHQSEDAIEKIHAIIWVERDSQKGIVIGNKAERLKKIGMAAREDMEKLLDKKVFLKLVVRVKKDWTDSATQLERMGYQS